MEVWTDTDKETGRGPGLGVGQHIHGVAAPCLEGRKDGASSVASRSRVAESGAHPGQAPASAGPKDPQATEQEAGVGRRRRRHRRVGPRRALGRRHPDQPGRDGCGPRRRPPATSSGPGAGPEKRGGSNSPIRGSRSDPARPGADQVSRGGAGLLARRNLLGLEDIGPGAGPEKRGGSNSPIRGSRRDSAKPGADQSRSGAGLPARRNLLGLEDIGPGGKKEIKVKAFGMRRRRCRR